MSGIEIEAILASASIAPVITTLLARVIMRNHEYKEYVKNKGLWLTNTLCQCLAPCIIMAFILILGVGK